MIVPAGVIYGNMSDIGVSGNAFFMSNWAGGHGGEKYAGRASLVALGIDLVVTPCERALFPPTFTVLIQRTRRTGRVSQYCERATLFNA